MDPGLQSEIEDSEIPEYRCPMSKKLFKNPQKLNCGCDFEEDSIIEF